MEEHEIQLIKQAKKGCQRAFESLYKLYKPAVLSTISTYYQDEDRVSDILSIVFTKAFKKLNKFIVNDSFKSWIKTIANNTCIDYKRKDKQERILQSVDDEENSYQFISEQPNVEESTIQVETLKHLKRCISKLPKRQGKALSMFYFEGKLYREIAKELAIPEGTIKSDISRAREKLKSIINNSV